MLKSILTAALARPLLLASSLLMSGHAGAQDFPTRPVIMVIPFAAGGPQDTIGRIVAQRMTELLGQQVVVENVGGAGGMTGSKRVADATPDGYTMILASVGTHAQNQSLYKKPLYNAATDFTPVAFLAETPIALIARPDLPPNTLKEFVDYAKANQTKMQFGSAGAGSATHLGCVVLNSAMGTSITHVPYRGTGPAMQDLIGGRIDFLCEIIATAKPQIDGGKVKGIAIMTKDRSPVLPNLPTAGEQGLDVQAYTWSALFLPKGASTAVVTKLNSAAIGAINTPSVQERLQKLGATVAKADQQSPEWLGKFVLSEIKKWEAPIKASGVSAD
jgi:tripartite-type tricarboxylate transporter receptor subunit TctC